MGKIWGWSGSVWTPIKQPHGWGGSAYNDIQKAWGWNGSAWGLLWQLSDPVTYNYYPSWTHGYMYDTGGQCRGGILSGVADDDLIQGYWESSQGSAPGPAGTWEHVSSMMMFNLGPELAERPVVKSGTLRLGLRVGYGGDPKNTNILLGHPAGVMTTTKPSTYAHSDLNKLLQDSGDLFTANGQVKTITLNAAMLSTIQTYRAFGMHDTGHNTTESGKRANRAIFYGANAASNLRPQLSVTLDYV